MTTSTSREDRLEDAVWTCPTCGKASLAVVQRDFDGSFEGQIYVVPQLLFRECNNCGEQLFSPVAMRRIEQESPAYHSRRRKRKAA